MDEVPVTIDFRVRVLLTFKSRLKELDGIAIFGSSQADVNDARKEEVWTLATRLGIVDDLNQV